MATTKPPEASATVDRTSAGDDEYTKNAVEQPHAQVLAAPQHEHEDYPVERVEAVYRKLDLRIIPGMFTPVSCIAADHSLMGLLGSPSLTMAQPSGSSTSSAPPSDPTSVSPRP